MSWNICRDWENDTEPRVTRASENWPSMAQRKNAALMALVFARFREISADKCRKSCESRSPSRVRPANTPQRKSSPLGVKPMPRPMRSVMGAPVRRMVSVWVRNGSGAACVPAGDAGTSTNKGTNPTGGYVFKSSRTVPDSSESQNGVDLTGFEPWFRGICLLLTLVWTGVNRGSGPFSCKSTTAGLSQ